MVLLGKKSFHSNKKEKDYFQIVVAYDGDAGCGQWADSIFVEKALYDSINENNFGKKCKLDYEYVGGSSSPRVVGIKTL